MSSYRPFCYNPSPNPAIPGTEQVGSIAAATGPTEVDGTKEWWMGPDEDPGYVICYVDPSGNHPNAPERVQGGSVPCNLGFKRTGAKTDSSFIDFVQRISGDLSILTGQAAKSWLNTNGYWTSWADTYSYEPLVNLSWPADSTGYTLYSGGFTSIDDGYSNLPISLPTAFSTNGVSSSNLYISTNGYFTLSNGDSSILSGPTNSNPASMAGNPSDNWLQTGLVMTDGDTQNAFYQTGTVGGTKHYVKLLVYGGTYGNPTQPRSWIANFYRDSAYQWLEVRAKSNLAGNAGPYNTVDVSQPSSTTSQVWRGDLNGQNWTYLGTGSIV